MPRSIEVDIGCKGTYFKKFSIDQLLQIRYLAKLTASSNNGQTVRDLTQLLSFMFSDHGKNFKQLVLFVVQPSFKPNVCFF